MRTCAHWRIVRHLACSYPVRKRPPRCVLCCEQQLRHLAATIHESFRKPGHGIYIVVVPIGRNFLKDGVQRPLRNLALQTVQPRLKGLAADDSFIHLVSSIKPAQRCVRKIPLPGIEAKTLVDHDGTIGHVLLLFPVATVPAIAPAPPGVASADADLLRAPAPIPCPPRRAPLPAPEVASLVASRSAPTTSRRRGPRSRRRTRPGTAPAVETPGRRCPGCTRRPDLRSRPIDRSAGRPGARGGRTAPAPPPGRRPACRRSVRFRSPHHPLRPHGRDARLHPL